MISTQKDQTIPKLDISQLSPERFVELYQKNNQPVVLTGLLGKDTNWNLDYLCQAIGEEEFFVRYYGQKRYQEEKQKWNSIGSGVAVTPMLFNQYAEMLRTGEAKKEDVYLAKASLKNTPLNEVNSLQELGTKLNLKPLTEYRMYMGHGGHTASLHYDIVDGTLCQMYGKKRVILFPPTVTKQLYPFPIWTHLRHGLKLRACYSRVDLMNPDYQQFPEFKEAQKYQETIILEAGEVLFIPVGWWHEITTLEAEEMSCSVSRFWQVASTAKNYLSWQRWRLVLGNILALPNIMQGMIKQILSQPNGETIKKILYKI
ncbi:UNVERIFIED_CONTAM: transcription factor jumonji jmjC domain-containing protein [Euhalothece sp. KZN 001]